MTVSEIVARPTEAVQKLFQQAGCPTAADADWGVFSHFKEAVAALGDSEIPRLSEQSVERLPHHSLVRFHGMVQDLLNPEYYVGAFQRPTGEWVTTKFSDPDMTVLDNYDSHEQPIVWERRPVMCVPIPGLSKWALPDAARPAQTATDASPPTRAAGDPSPLASIGEPSPQAAPVHQAASRAAKRERSSDADAQLDADPERGGGGAAAAAAADSAAAPPPLDNEDSMQDTDLAGDQGPGPMAAAATAGAGAEEDEGVARPRIRRREDRTTSGTDAAAAPASPGEADVGGSSAAGAGAAVQSDVHGNDGGAAAAAAAAAAGVPGQESRPASGEVPGSCMIYLYDNAPALVLHEVVEIIGVVSHVPQLAALEYDNQDPLLEHDLASLELTARGGGGGAAPMAAAQDLRGGGGGESGTVADRGNGERLVFEATRAAHPPTSKVMRVHAILVRRNPSLLSPDADEPPSSAAAAVEPTATAASEASPSVAATAGTGAAPPPRPLVAPLRDRALGLLRWALGGDVVAAEYVLMQLLGRVAARGDPAALGQLTINLCRCPAAPTPALQGPSAAASAAACSSNSISRPALAAERLGRGPSPLCTALHAAISCLVPLSVALPLTVESCNGVSWAPQRDPVRERTRPSPLQLAPGTLVLLDETMMVPGQLRPEGVASLQALQAVSRQQELPYDFETFQHPVPVDLPLILLTEGRSLLRDSVHVRVPLNATQPLPGAEEILAAAHGSDLLAAVAAEPGIVATTTTETAADASMMDGAASAAAIPAAELAAVRSYLAAARAPDGYGMAEGMPAVLEQYFVDARRPEAGGGGGTGAAAGAGANPAAAAAGGGGMTAEEFHTKLTLARLLVRSHGERQLTRARWQQLLQLEHTREARLRVMA
ncbi:hypothetical protein PLESTB_001336100 [Pleodorina starrii]|uniref:Mini-chromosome maintenance complex-binding protein n=1 Tax=Pleodorina starrii TaxID=330485 RepID=A0A9W6BUE3_9CHLO|nr:hypothetical protein PLESTB_001336100 [Pleodorina starrii]